MINRRNSVRYIMEVKVSVKTEGDAPGTMIGEVLDLSAIGWGLFLKKVSLLILSFNLI